MFCRVLASLYGGTWTWHARATKRASRGEIGGQLTGKYSCICLLGQIGKGIKERGSMTVVIGSLSSDVFERRTSTGSEPFSLLISLDVTIFLLPSVLIVIETICSKICSKTRLKSAKSPLPVDVRRSKTSLLKLPIKTF